MPDSAKLSLVRPPTSPLPENRKVVVTGGAGFVGQVLVKQLLADGFEVHIIDNFFLRSPHAVPEGAVLHTADIRDRQAMVDIFAEVRPETVFHLAAQTSVAYSMDHPVEDMEINVNGTVNVMEGAKAAGDAVKHVVAFGTAAEYGTPATLPMKEGEHPTDPTSFYGNSKHFSATYVDVYGAQNGWTVTHIRPGNIIGSGQLAQPIPLNVLPHWKRALDKGDAPRIFGDGTATRDYVHVEDVVSATLIAARAHYNGLLNVASGVQTSTMDLFEEVALATGFHGAPELLPPRAGDPHDSVLDVSNLRSLGWEPHYTLREAIQETMKDTHVPVDFQESAPKAAAA